MLENTALHITIQLIITIYPLLQYRENQHEKFKINYHLRYISSPESTMAVINIMALRDRKCCTVLFKNLCESYDSHIDTMRQFVCLRLENITINVLPHQ